MPSLDPVDLLHAYCEGVFPMGEKDGSISWFRPRMRGILPIAEFHVPRRFERYLKTCPFETRWDTAFGDVLRGCADREETWITDVILEAYEELFRMGFAHSSEVWRDGRLVGGVYGVAIGGAFFGAHGFRSFFKLLAGWAMPGETHPRRLLRCRPRARRSCGRSSRA